MPRKSKNTGEGFLPHEALSPVQKLSTITSKPLTALNINTYHDEALNAIIALVDTSVAENFKNNPEDGKLSIRELENKIFGEDAISETLTSITEMKVDMTAIDMFIDTKVQHLPAVIVPTDGGKKIEQGSGVGFEHQPLRDQLKMTLFMLQQQGISLEEITAEDGVMHSSVVRKTSYTALTIPRLARTVLVCDERGNASYVFDTSKLESNGIDSVIRDTKKDLNTYLLAHPNHGVRVVDGKKWNVRMAEALFNPIEGRKGNLVSEEIVPVSYDTKDEWYGFYAAPDGKHYGSLRALERKFGVTRDMLGSRIQGLPIQFLKSPFNPLTLGYAYEDIEKIIAGYKGKPIVELHGEWEGFYEKGGWHYGSSYSLADKIGVSQLQILKLVKNIPVPFISVRAKSGPFDAYPLEIVRWLLSDMVYPQVQTESGEWHGYYEENGIHYGSLTAIAERLGFTRIKFRTIITEKNKIPSKYLRSSINQGETMYSYEHIKAIVDARNETTVAPDGEWAGFLEKDGKRYGTIPAIAVKIGLTHSSRLYSYIETKGLKPSMLVNTSNSKDVPAYDYGEFTELEQSIKRILSLPHVSKEETETAWRHFYTKDGKHYGSMGAIALRLKEQKQITMHWVRVKDLVDENGSLVLIDMVDPMGSETKGYAYEDVERLLNEKKEITAKDTGEWRDFLERDGEHYGGMDALERKLGISHYTLTVFLEKNPSLSSIKMYGRTGVLIPKAYSFEEIERLYATKK